MVRVVTPKGQHGSSDVKKNYSSNLILFFFFLSLPSFQKLIAEHGDVKKVLKVAGDLGTLTMEDIRE